MEGDYSSVRTGGRGQLIKEFYKEDPVRCMNWFITGSANPECPLSPEDFADHYGEEWASRPEPEHDNRWDLISSISEFDSGRLMEKLYDIDALTKVINSRENMSAVGRDGISNVVWKTDPLISAKLTSALLVSMFKYSRVPSSWKSSRTVMIFKKGDPTCPSSWCPISISSTLYRIAMCHLSNLFQETNSSSPFLSRTQKGFLRTVNGVVEHFSILNEIIADSSRSGSSLNILTIDLQNAFVSISHQQIVRSLRVPRQTRCLD